MSPGTKTRAGGPFEAITWPEALAGHVATPGAAPRLHGYDVEDDLARHYGPADCALLALTGELPPAPLRAAAEVALAFMAPAPVSEAPSHAALVARLCGASSSALIGVGAVTLAEQAQALVERQAALLAWLDRPEGDLPASATAADEAERRSVERLRQAWSSATPRRWCRRGTWWWTSCC